MKVMRVKERREEGTDKEVEEGVEIWQPSAQKIFEQDQSTVYNAVTWHWPVTICFIMYKQIND